MAVEEKVISTRTQVNTTENTIDIFVYYVENQQLLLSFFISDVVKIVEGVNFIEGELGYTQENVNDLFVKNNSGDLIVASTNPERYSINENGELIYEE